jgi:hypothetical protein
MRTFDPVLVQFAIGEYAENIVGLNLEDWLYNDANVALTNTDGDVALFERQWQLPSSVCGHYFFHSRGRRARDVAKEFLKEIFTGPYEVQIITGLTPVDHRGALWMNKQLGFKSHGQIEVDDKVYEFVLLTKQEWLQQESEE